MPDCDGPAVMFTGKMAAAGLTVVEETPLAAETARWGWGRQRCQLHRELESVKMLVWAATGMARGLPADRPTKTEAVMAADRQERP